MPPGACAIAPVDTVIGVITGELRSKVDQVWNAFWSGGIANPLQVVEQVTYLLFIRRLDELQTLAENKANTLKQPVEREIFPDGPSDARRWHNFVNLDPQSMFEVVSAKVFPFLRQLGGDGSTYSAHMRDATFVIPGANLLDKVVQLIAEIPMDRRDTNGDLYEYMLGKIASAGQNGQFRTPRHIISLMVEMLRPTPKDTIIDPAAGTAGFLVGAAEYLRRENPSLLYDDVSRHHFHHSMFHGYDFDSTMLRIGSMNMLMHGIESPDIAYRDSLSEGAAGSVEVASVLLANPPFAGSLDYESTSKELQQVVKTKKTELLFLALFLKLLTVGGRAAVIVPDGVLFGSSKAHKTLRKSLVEEHQLQGVVKLPSGVFKPYAGVSTAILLFTKTGIGGTDHVWFYDVAADGWSLDDKRTPLLDEAKLGPVPDALVGGDHGESAHAPGGKNVPAGTFLAAEHAKNNLPDALARWFQRDGTERGRARTEQSFCVPKAEIAEQDYDLSLNRYKEIVYEEVEHRPPLEILEDLERLEGEITAGISELKAML